MIFVLALGAVMAAAPPEGWRQLPEPPEALLECANRSKHEWRVSLHEGRVRIEPKDLSQGSAKPVLPFTPPEKLFSTGWSHVLEVNNGYFVGSEGGQWGGVLYWFSADGKRQWQIAMGTVRGLVASRPGEVLSLLGPNDPETRRGRVRWSKQTASGHWSFGEQDSLDAIPHTFTATGDVVYVVTATSLTKVGPGHHVKVLEPLPAWLLYPNSIVVDSGGAIWVGMRHFVLRLVPEGKRFTREWFVPRTCLKATQAGGDCVCPAEARPPK